MCIGMGEIPSTPHCSTYLTQSHYKVLINHNHHHSFHRHPLSSHHHHHHYFHDHYQFNHHHHHHYHTHHYHTYNYHHHNHNHHHYYHDHLTIVIDTIDRAIPIWNTHILHDLRAGRNVLIVGHRNR